MAECKCGCGETPKRGRVFVNKEHQINWMLAGGAQEMNAMLPDEVRERGGRTSGRRAVESGRLAEAAKEGGRRAREIADQLRQRRDSN